MNTHLFLTFACSTTISCLSPASDPSIDINGDALYGLCTDYDRVTDSSACLGYITGIENVMARGDAVGGQRACPKKPVDERQLLSIVRDYLREDGDQGVYPASSLVASALAQAFPCRR